MSLSVYSKALNDPLKSTICGDSGVETFCSDVSPLDFGCAYGYVGQERFKDYPNEFVLGIDIN